VVVDLQAWLLQVVEKLLQVCVLLMVVPL